MERFLKNTYFTESVIKILKCYGYLYYAYYIYINNIYYICIVPYRLGKSISISIFTWYSFTLYQDYFVAMSKHQRASMQIIHGMKDMSYNYFIYLGSSNGLCPSV